MSHSATHQSKPAAGQPLPDGNGATLREALIESRQRWRQFGAMATDLAFETDANGILRFVAPESALGWPAADLLGQPASALLLDPGGPEFFSGATALYRRSTWFRTRRQQPVCMALTVTPVHGVHGVLTGARAVAVNVTEQEQASMASAAALRRAAVLDHVLGCLREEVMAPRMMQALLCAVLGALGAAGAAVLDLDRPGPGGDETPVLHAAGEEPGVLRPLLGRALAAAHDTGGEASAFQLAPGGTQCIACTASSRFGQRAALVLWRPSGHRAWDEDETITVTSVTGVMRMVLEHESIQRELARQARTDPMTGLLNRRAFFEEAERRLDRLERDGLPATLLYMDLDRLKVLNDRAGHAAGDEALTLVAALLSRTFRPTDLIARLGGDEFAAWLDGADAFTAAERAEALRIAVPQELAHLVLPTTTGTDLLPGISIGIACREPGSGEELVQLLERADKVMYAVKRGGRGHWRVSLADQAT